MALTLLSPLCLSGHYGLVYSQEAFFRFTNGLHDKETTGLSLLELLFLQGGASWQGPVLLSLVWGQVRVGAGRSLGSEIERLRPLLTSCVALASCFTLLSLHFFICKMGVVVFFKDQESQFT